MTGDRVTGEKATGDDDPVGEDDLLAYVDERLTSVRKSKVIRYLEANPEIKARIHADKTTRDWLRQRLDPIEAQPIPDRLRIDRLLARQRESQRRWMLGAAASIALLVAGGTVGWLARGVVERGTGPQQRIALNATAADALSAHRVYVVETAHPVEVGAAQEQHLVQWLSRRLKHKLLAPDLSRQGYVLVGGRLLPASSEAAAQFMYENGSGTRLTLYVKAVEGADTQFRYVTAQGLAAFSWVDKGLGFALVGPLDHEHLLSVADSVYQQVDPGHRPAPDAAL
ncbi:MAG: anti-sigma factor family protein [Rhodopila sp.]